MGTHAARSEPSLPPEQIHDVLLLLLADLLGRSRRCARFRVERSLTDADRRDETVCPASSSSKYSSSRGRPCRRIVGILYSGTPLQRAAHVIHPHRQREAAARFLVAETARVVVADPRDRRRACADNRRTTRRASRWSCPSCRRDRCASTTLVFAPVPRCATLCSRLFITYALRGSIACGALCSATSGCACDDDAAARIGDFGDQIRIDAIAAVCEHRITRPPFAAA